MSRHNLALFFALVGFFASGTVYADPLVMAIENVFIYVDEQLDEKATSRLRTELVGAKATLEFFSQSDIIRLSWPEQKDPAVCERIQESFTEDKYRCTTERETMTLTLKTVGAYIRSGILTGVSSYPSDDGKHRKGVVELSR